MKQEPLDVEARRLFEAARRESPSAEARQRALSALRSAEPQADLPSRSRWPIVAGLSVAAATLLALSWPKAEQQAIGISAEALEPSSSETPKVDKEAEERAEPSQSASEDTEVLREIPTSTSDPSSPARPASPRPATLEQELTRIQHARALLGSGDAAGALTQLDDFARFPGWRQLSVEASLLRIEALSGAGRSEEAQQLAQQFVAKHPNNPLIDRARALAGDAGMTPDKTVEREED